jgi:hypothetical protein
MNITKVCKNDIENTMVSRLILFLNVKEGDHAIN